MKKAAAYGRYSTDMQREESIDAQFRAIREYCARNGILLIAEYADEGISGTTDNRPQFQQMIADAQNGLFDYVIVHKLDRFSRSKYDSAIYKRKLKQSGVQLLSVLENLDGSPESIILESVLEGMSEYYSRNLSREVKKGLNENAFKCKFNGGTPPLGFDIDKSKDYIINTYEAEIVKIIFNMFAGNRTYGEIMNYLNERNYKTKLGNKFTRNSFYEILRNEKYIGTYTFSKEDYKVVGSKRNWQRKKDKEKMIYIEDGIPAIIDKNTWNQVQDRLENNKQRQKTNKNGRFYMLTGLLFCKECGAPMSGTKITNSYGKNYYYYKCNNRVRTRSCKSLSVRAEKIENDILECFNEVIFTESNKEVIVEAMIKFLDNSNDIEKSKMIKKEIDKVDKEINNLLNAIMQGVNALSIKDRLEELEGQKESLNITLSKLKTQNNDLGSFENQIRDFLDTHHNIFNYTSKEQSLILRMFIDRIEFEKGQIHVKLKMIDNKDICGAGKGT